MKIEWNPMLNTMDSAILKLLPNNQQMASEKVAEKTKELEEAKQEEAKTTQQEQQQEMPPQATAGSQIQGFSGNENEGMPTDQPGTTATPTVGITRSYFMDNFGTSGDQIIKIMQENGEESIIPRLINLLKQEQDALLKEFSWWRDSDWGHIDVRDNDFNMLATHGERLEFLFRKAVVSSRNADEETREAIWKEWSDRLNAESRLSRREYDILSKASQNIDDYGGMTSQMLASHSTATSAEIAMLIKSHGFLFDIEVVGKARNNDSKALLYGKQSPKIMLKNADNFIANLWDVGGHLEITPSGSPRLFLPFTSKRGDEFTVVLKESLGVGNIMWEDRQFVIEGDLSVQKATRQAYPYLNENKRDAAVLLKSYEGDETAMRLLTYTYASKKEQVELLKAWGMSEDKLKRAFEVIAHE